MFTSVWLGLLACGPLYHEKSARYVSDIPGVMKLCGAHVALSQSVDFSLVAPARKDQPRAAEPLTRGLLEDTSSDTRSFGEKKKTSKKKTNKKNTSLLFFSLPFFPQGGRQLLRLLVYLAGCSLARTLVCLTCLYETLSVHRCPDAFLSNTDEPQGRSVGWNTCLVAVTGPHPSQEPHAKSWEPGGLPSLQDLIHFCGFNSGGLELTPIFSALQLFWLQLSCLNILGLGILIWKGRKFLSKILCWLNKLIALKQLAVYVTHSQHSVSDIHDNDLFNLISYNLEIVPSFQIIWVAFPTHSGRI